MSRQNTTRRLDRTNNRVAATLVGYMEIATDKSAVRTLRLVTSQATYANHAFAAVVSSLRGE